MTSKGQTDDGGKIATNCSIQQDDGLLWVYDDLVGRVSSCSCQGDLKINTSGKRKRNIGNFSNSLPIDCVSEIENHKANRQQ